VCLLDAQSGRKKASRELGRLLFRDGLACGESRDATRQRVAVLLHDSAGPLLGVRGASDPPVAMRIASVMTELAIALWKAAPGMLRRSASSGLASRRLAVA
jgi:hypothetical protein